MDVYYDAMNTCVTPHGFDEDTQFRMCDNKQIGFLGFVSVIIFESTILNYVCVVMICCSLCYFSHSMYLTHRLRTIKSL